MSKTKSLSLLGYASGIAAADKGTGDGPVVLAKSNLSAELSKAGIKNSWSELLYPKSNMAVLPATADLCNRLAQQTYALTKQQQLFTVFGGDHSCAVGTWSGAFAALENKGSLGMIWIDAHMDSHTPESSESGNIHGMPVACLLGYGAPELTQILKPQAKIKPANLSLIGIRSYEAGEAELIKRLGVRVYDMAEINQRGIEVVIKEALARAKQGTAGYGISIDLDGLDPKDAPGVGTAEPNGIDGAELCQALTQLRNDSHLVGLEITEFNPHHDHEHRTEQMIQDLLLAML